MNDDIKNQIIEHKTKVLRARVTMALMVILSAINVFLVMISSGSSKILMPFSCGISTYAILLGNNIYMNNNNSLFYIAGLLVAIIIIVFLAVCYFKSKNSVLYLLIAVSVSIIDLFSLIAFSFNGFFIKMVSLSNVSTNIIIHMLIIWYLIVGIKSFKTLGKLNEIPDATIIAAKDEEYENSSIPSFEASNDDDEYDVLMSVTFNEHLIVIAIRNGYTELIIDGNVCDSVNSAYNSEYELNGNINCFNINFQYKRSYSSETAFLYANNDLLESLYKDNF